MCLSSNGFFKPHNQTILIVDNNPSNLNVLSSYLESSGYRVLSARDGESALESASSAKPDLICMDVMMPGMDGFETCRRLKADAALRGIPVVFMTSLYDTREKDKGFQSGAVDYITRPLEQEEVLARLATHLRLRKLTDRLEQAVHERTNELMTSNQQLRQEIAERKRAEAELIRYRDQLEELVQQRTVELESALNKTQQYLNTAGVIMVAIDANRKITLINQKGCDVLEVTEVEAVGQDWFETFIPEKSRRDVINIFCMLMSGELEQIEYYENTVLTKSGEEKLIAWHNVLLRDNAGNITGALSSGEDITQRKLAEEHIKKLNQVLQERAAELEAVNKELDAFAYSISHDLRAPLRHIDGFLKLLKQSVSASLDEKGKHYMATVLKVSNRMGRMIDDLLTFSRTERQALSKTDINLEKLIQETIGDFKLETDSRAIQWHIGDLPVVWADRMLIGLVLTNLISNAIKFTKTRTMAEIEIGGHNQQGESILFVRDNGVGFDMKYIDKLFGAFQRLHNIKEFEGSGIGLANVYRIIKRHGGRTWAEGNLDKGATFYFSLPSSERAAD